MEATGNIFDVKQALQNITRDAVLQLLGELRRVAEQLEGTGQYILLPPEPLALRGWAYYTQYKDDVAQHLTASGVDGQVRETFLTDYLRVLTGLFDVQMPILPQGNIFNAVKAYKLYFIERYGVNVLLRIYMHNFRAATDYINNFKTADGHVTDVTTHRTNGELWDERTKRTIPVEEQKRLYIERQIKTISSGSVPLWATSLKWLRGQTIEYHGERIAAIEPADFSGVEPDLTNKFLGLIDVYSGVGDYVNYYYIAKYALKATDDELRAINTPPIFDDDAQAREYAERVSLLWYRNVQKRTAAVEKMLDADNLEDVFRAQQEITNADKAEQEIIPYSENVALILSRDVYASTEGTRISEQGVIPISKVITIYNDKHDLPNGVTPYVIERTISGLNMLQRFNHDAPVNGWYNYETNITEFSRLCGYEQANGEEMKAILTALSILHNLYLVVWKPKGKVAINLLTVPEIGVSGELKGRFKLQVRAEALKGHQTFTTIGEIRRLQKETKGQAQFHFNHQLKAKGHKEENALLNEVYGYDTMIYEATGNTGDERVNPDAVRNVKEYIRKKKPTHKKQIAQWFDDYVRKGILEYHVRKQNKRGEWVHEWRLANGAQILPNPDGEK